MCVAHRPCRRRACHPDYHERTPDRSAHPPAHTAPADLTVLIEIPINRFQARHDRSDLICSECIEGARVRQRHESGRDLARTCG
jgi:hypothetical protein